MLKVLKKGPGRQQDSVLHEEPAVHSLVNATREAVEQFGDWKHCTALGKRWKDCWLPAFGPVCGPQRIFSGHIRASSIGQKPVFASVLLGNQDVAEACLGCSVLM